MKRSPGLSRMKPSTAWAMKPTFGSPSSGAGKALNASAKLLYGRDSDKPGALRRGLFPLMRVGGKTLRDVFKR